MGDAMDKHCLQNPLDVVEGVTHAGQAATRHVTLHTDYILCCDYYSAPPAPHCCHTPQVFGMTAGLSAQRLELCSMATEPPGKHKASGHSLHDPVLAAGEVIFGRVDEGKAEVEH